tara:strand:+ start:114 stop:461 length:348 start_codon:yes stop_codon:yes gene_type:complete
MGIFDAIAGSIRGGSSKGKVKQRVKKLENQVRSLNSKQNQGPTSIEQPIEVTGQEPLGVVPDQIGMEEETPELLPNNPTVASPFTPGAAAAGNSMFGAQVPGSFNRDMGEEEEIY